MRERLRMWRTTALRLRIERHSSNVADIFRRGDGRDDMIVGRAGCKGRVAVPWTTKPSP